MEFNECVAALLTTRTCCSDSRITWVFCHGMGGSFRCHLDDDDQTTTSLQFALFTCALELYGLHRCWVNKEELGLLRVESVSAAITSTLIFSSSSHVVAPSLCQKLPVA